MTAYLLLKLIDSSHKTSALVRVIFIDNKTLVQIVVSGLGILSGIVKKKYPFPMGIFF